MTKHPITKTRNKHSTEKETKIEILRHAGDLADNLRTQGCFVWHADDKTYSVYSLELKEEVRDYRDFLEINGNRSHYKGYRYIGQTNKTTEERYKIQTGRNENGKRFTAAAAIAHKYAVGINWDTGTTHRVCAQTRVIASRVRSFSLSQVFQTPESPA